MAVCGHIVSTIQEDYLTCQICQEYYTQPKALPCLHTFCQACLQDFILSRSYQTQGKFPCPVCRVEVLIPNGGVAYFPNNHLVISLADTVGSRATGADQEGVHVRPNTGGVSGIGGQAAGGSLAAPPTIPPRPQPRAEGTGAPSLYPYLPVDQWDPQKTGASTGSLPVDQWDPEKRPTASSEAEPESTGQVAPPIGWVLPKPESPQPLPSVQDGMAFSFGQYGNLVVDFTQPIGVTGTTEGHIVVSDHRDSRILVYDGRGRLRNAFKCDAENFDVAAAPNGSIYVAVNKTRAGVVYRYRLNGERIGVLGSLFKSEIVYGITATLTDHPIVTSLANNCIIELNENGKMVRKFGSRGKRDNTFMNPYYVAVNNKKGYIIVSDCDNNCIKIFDSNGNFKRKMGGAGRNPGQLLNPKGICVDKFGNIIVADSGNHRVQIFGNDGHFHGVLIHNTKERAFGHDVRPQSVALLRDDRLAVLVTGPQYAQVRVYEHEQDGKDEHNVVNWMFSQLMKYVPT